METYFSVGEISKLTNVPIQTLRYYDKMGLLKSAYINEQENVILPKGNYLTMYYDDGYKNNLRYYKIMLDYINKNHIETVGDFNEFSILSRINTKEAEKSIIQLEIQIK